MLTRLGVKGRPDASLGLCLLAMVALSPLGTESTSPWAFLAHRTLLLAAITLCVSAARSALSRYPCWFYVALAVLLGGLLLFAVGVEGSRFDSLYLWYRHLFFVALFVALSLTNQGRSVEWKTVLLCGVIAISILHLGVALIGSERPLLGTFSNHNYFASFLMVGFAGALALFGFHPDLRLRAAGAAAAAFLFLGMTQTWSRGATLSALLVSGVAFIRMRNRWVLLAAGVVLLAIVLTNADLVIKFTDPGVRDPYNYMRPQIWASTARMIAAYPLTGVGFGQYYHYAKGFNFPIEGMLARYMKVATIAHSEYLHYAAEVGVPMTLLLLALIGYVFWRIVRAIPSIPSTHRFLQEAALLAGIGVGAHAVVDNNWTTPLWSAAVVMVSLASLSLAPARPVSVESSRLLGIALAGVLALIYFHSTVLTAAGLYYNARGQQAFRQDDLETAERSGKLATAIVPGHAVFHDNLGMVYLFAYLRSRDGSFLDLAQARFQRAAEANPRDDQPFRHLESVLIQRLTGNAAADLSIHQQIIEIDRKALEISPYNAVVRKNMAQALYLSGRREEGLHEMRRAIETEPNFVPAYLRLAEWFGESGDDRQRAECLRAAEAIESRFRNAKLQDPYEGLLLGRTAEPNPGN